MTNPYRYYERDSFNNEHIYDYDPTEDKFFFFIIDQDTNELYFEDCSGYWRKTEYDKNGNFIRFTDSFGTIEENI